MNGPVPTGVSLVKVTGSSTSFQMLRHDHLLADVVETRGVDLIEGHGDGLLVRRLDALDERQYPADALGAGQSLVRHQEVKGELDVLAGERLPSDHMTPSRRVKVMVVLSSLNSQAVASQGTISLVIVL